MSTPRDHAIAAFIGRFGREPDASELRFMLDRMLIYLGEHARGGFHRTLPPVRPAPKPRKAEPIVDPHPERG